VLGLGHPVYTGGERTPPCTEQQLDAFEGFLAKLTRHRLERGAFKSLVDLKAVINRLFAKANDNPKALNR
jgi:hypothetical protein